MLLSFTSSSGYFVEVLGSPATCFDPQQYGALLVVDPGEACGLTCEGGCGLGSLKRARCTQQQYGARLVVDLGESVWLNSCERMWVRAVRRARCIQQQHGALLVVDRVRGCKLLGELGCLLPPTACKETQFAN